MGKGGFVSFGAHNTYIGAASQVGSKVIQDAAIEDTSLLYRDHFTRVLNTEDWATTTANGGTVTDDLTNHSVNLNGANQANCDSCIYGKYASNLSVVNIEMVFKCIDGAETLGALYGYCDTARALTTYGGVMRNGVNSACLRTVKAGGGTTNSASFTVDWTASQIYKLTLTSAAATLYRYESGAWTQKAQNAANLPAVDIVPMFDIGQNNVVATAKIDYVSWRQTAV